MTKEEFYSRVIDIHFQSPDATPSALEALWADIEAERGVVVDWSKAPNPHVEGVVMGWDFNGELAHISGEVNTYSRLLQYIPRPAPKYREMTREEKESELLKRSNIVGMSDEELDRLCAAAGIETRVVV